ncbi:CmpA/NrtA family ABC transporter substrate-binding protein [Undibacterium sp. RuRC25W]|uniref:CmpA/NrtA family ABC transporter substrate-binding protein n=1 Tax=Undibacterium sp. RuRC25W TaxID=3413047 RepID=UPI003BF26EF8
MTSLPTSLSAVTDVTSSAPPERPHLRIGYVALIDSAPLIVAKQMGFDQRHGITLELYQQPSWAAIRDKLLSGELDAAQTLYGLVYGVQIGLGGPQADMAILMTLNRNGQAITVSNQLADQLKEGQSLRAALKTLGRKPVFAQTFPTGTHAMWLNYWLAANGIHPVSDVESIVIPPPQMPEALAHGELDGFCAGEPWHAVAEHNKSGRTIVSSSQIWPDHPEKALACRREFAALYPNTVQALIRAMLESCQWIEATENKWQLSTWLAQPEYLHLAQDLIQSRLVGRRLDDENAERGSNLPIRFFTDATTNYPLPADGLWFLSQFYRWGLLKSTSDWDAIVNQVCQTALYTQATQQLELTLEPTKTTEIQFIDGQIWDGHDAVSYAKQFTINAVS